MQSFYEVIDVLIYIFVLDLLDATKFNQLGKMKNLITKDNFNICDEKGNSLLIVASTHGNQDMCKILIESGGLVDKRNYDGDTALINAAYYGHIELCVLLLQNDAQVNKMIQVGYFPLLVSAQNSYFVVCTSLIE